MQKPFMCASVGFVQPIRDVLGSYRRRVEIGDDKSESVFDGFTGPIGVFRVWHSTMSPWWIALFREGLI